MTLAQEDEGPTSLTRSVTELNPGKHGFSIQQFGDYSAGCGSIGGYLNPAGKKQGAPSDEIRHAGDLGNIACC